MTRIIIAALAALAIATPAATAMPTDPSGVAQAGTAPVVPHTESAPACPDGTRAVQGAAGTGCTTSPRNDSGELGEFAVILTGAAALGIALGAGARRRDRRSTAPAFSRTS